MRRTSQLFGALSLAVVLSGCGLFGDSDAEASPAPDESIDPGDVAVRVSFDDRWFEISANELAFSATGEPTPATLAMLSRHVTDLSVASPAPIDARIDHDGRSFVVLGGSPGQEPDTAALAINIRQAADANRHELPVPFSTVAPDVTVEMAEEFAESLNRRTVDGLKVAVAGSTNVLSASIIGATTDIVWDGFDWQVSLRWNGVESELARLFPDAVKAGSQATFTVDEPEEGEEGEATVRIVAGAPATVCCAPSSARRIEQALENDIEVAALFLGQRDAEQGIEWAKNLGIIEPVGSFTTNYKPGQNRVKNIRLIAELVQGVVIEPGETFSLNVFVGERTRAKGFVPAGTIINGRLIDNVGGGISQFATTIFNASFFAGLEFDEYQSHSIYFSRYPYGREATISFPLPNLEIRNPTEYGMLLWPTSTATSITVDIYSTKLVDVEQTGQWERTVGVACTRVTTERTRTNIADGTSVVDTVFAVYRAEGIACDGSKTYLPGEEPDDEDAEEDLPPGEEGGDGLPPEDQPDPDPPVDDPPPEDPPVEDPPPDNPPPDEPPPDEDPQAEDPPPDV